jgi:hypothetical protein
VNDEDFAEKFPFLAAIIISLFLSPLLQKERERKSLALLLSDKAQGTHK